MTARRAGKQKIERAAGMAQSPPAGAAAGEEREHGGGPVHSRVPPEGARLSAGAPLDPLDPAAFSQ